MGIIKHVNSTGQTLSSVCLALLVSLSVSLMGCALQTEQEPDLALNIHSAFSASGDVPMRAQWWVLLGDDHLNQWVEAGLQNNQTLKAALARLKQSQAAERRAHSDLFPSLNLNAQQKQKRTDNGSTEITSAGLSSSWEVDLWGRLSALEDKADWQRIASEAAVRGRANLVAGNVSSAWFGWLLETEKSRLLDRQYQRIEQALQAIKRRFSLGRNSVSDIWQQSRLLESIRSQQAQTSAKAARHRQQLVLWLGAAAIQLPAVPQGQLQPLPALPETGLPLETLRQRPDIQQAYANLQAANADVAAAISERFPRLTLNARHDSTESLTNNLFDNWVTELSAGFVLPIIDAGNRRDKVEQRKAALSVAQADYRQRWYEAINEVENALISEHQYKQQVNSISSQLHLARKAQQFEQLSYMNGKASYLQLLRTQETTLQLERQQVDAQRQLILARIALYRALSHGNFATSQPVAAIANHSLFANRSAIDTARPL